MSQPSSLSDGYPSLSLLAVKLKPARPTNPGSAPVVSELSHVAWGFTLSIKSQWLDPWISVDSYPLGYNISLLL